MILPPPDVRAIDGAENREAGYWWRQIGDPVLANLVERGLARNQEIACEALALNKAVDRAAARDKRLDIQINRFFGSGNSGADRAVLMAHAYRHAARRARLAAEIAEAYIEVRRLQEVLALREAVQSQYSDNAEIASFRREAGLVSGIDTGVAGSLQAVAATGLETTRVRYRNALAALAKLVTARDTIIDQMLGQRGQVPDIAGNALTAAEPNLVHRADLLSLSQQLSAQLIRKGQSPLALDAEESSGVSAKQGDAFADQARASYRKAQDGAAAEQTRLREVVAAATEQEDELAQRAALARRTVEDARLAYRGGTGDFATLFVAEAAALALEEARVTARADMANAMIRFWTSLGSGWENADLMPQEPAQDTDEVLVCE